GMGLLAAARQKPAAWFFAPALLFFGWMSMARFVSPVINDTHLLAHVDGATRWTITGTVDSDPEITGNRQVFLFRVTALETGEKRFEPRGRLRVTLYDAFDRLDPGTGLRFSGIIRPIRNFANPGAFNYRNYMAYQNVFGLAYAPVDRVAVLDENAVKTPRHRIESLRVKIAGAIDKAAPGARAGVVKALVVGKKEDIAPRVREAFVRSGTAHLLAISGLHVGIVATVVFALFSRLFSFWPALLWNGWVKKSAAMVTLCFVAGYGVIAGMSPSTQRAVIMVAVFLLSFVVQRDPRLLNTLALAALAILLTHPPSLFSVSFQLSFAAVLFIVLGMAVTRAPVERISSRPVKFAVNFVLVSSFATAGTAPLTLHYFNQTSLVGLISNCILIPLVGFIAVPLGLAGVPGHLLWPPAGAALFGLAGAVVDFSIGIAAGLSALPFAAVSSVTPGLLEMACLYVLMLSGLAFAYQWLAASALDMPGAQNPGEKAPSGQGRWVRRGPQIAFALSLLILMIDAGWWVCHRFLHKDLRVTILDVGQGNAAVLELPGGKVVLIDGGGFAGTSTFDPGEKVVAPFLWRNKIRTVDTVIATHPDTDHIGGLAFIADRFYVRELWTNGQPKETEDYAALMAAVRRRNILMPAHETLVAGRTVTGVKFEFLYPPVDFAEKSRFESWRNTNNNSLVTRVGMGDVSFLFPGDISKKAELELAALAGDRLASTVVVAPHHGSKTSSTPAFLNRVRPDVAVVSAGAGNRYGYPHPEVVLRYQAAGARVLRTDRDGAVVLKTRGHGLTVETPCGP
ncbi:MAG: ComEC/Rec2 family competence protein, partial [Thermodesulfobacteriota bacterium]